MIWEKKEVDPGDVKKLAKQFGLDLLTASIFVRRDITSAEKIRFYLENDLHFLHNPFLMEGMEEAVDRINMAIESGDKILAFGDRDVDGITSTVMIVDTLRSLGANIEWALPIGDENYGLTNEVIEKAEESGVKLLITLDCGISNIDEIELANSKGIDSIIVDHHNPHDYLPDAVAVINPKIEESGYPYKTICGCAVTHKLIWALLFSRTKYYDTTLCLVNITPVNGAYAIEAVKLHNLVERDRLLENYVPGMVSFDQCRLGDFLEDTDIFVFDVESQKRQFAELFGEQEELRFIDLKPPVIKSFPALEGKGLLKIKEMSRLAKYTPLKEIDVLKNLVISHIYKSETELTAQAMEKMAFVALGTIADIMPLENENRIFVKLGLQALSQCRSRGLRQLLIRQDLYGKKITSKDVGWNISPIINASGRMGEPDKAAKLLLSEDQKEIEELVEYIIGLNKQRKSLGDKLWKSLMPKANTCFEKTGGKMVMVAGKDVHRGITGILATRFVKFFNVSALVIAVLKDKVVGSMRSTRNVNAKEFLHKFEGILNDFGGHDMAAGFTLKSENLEAFKERFYEVAKHLEPTGDKEEKIVVDAEIPLSYLTQELWKVVEMFDPYGECSRPLYFMSRGLVIQNIDLMGKKDMDHVRFLMDAGQTKWPAVMWSAAERVGKDFKLNDRVDIVYQINKNIFQNTETLRLTIMDIKKS